MSDALNLQSFCGSDPFRPELHKPFSYGEFTYATNGRIMVRIPRRADIPDNEKKANWDKPLDGIDAARFSPLQHLPLPPLSEPEEEDCSACDGRGHEHDCPECSCTCDVCAGSGKEMVEDQISTVIRGAIYNLRYVTLMLALPGVEIMTDKKSLDVPLFFKFDGGVGAVMPMRGQYARHVKIEIDEAA